MANVDEEDSIGEESRGKKEEAGRAGSIAEAIVNFVTA